MLSDHPLRLANAPPADHIPIGTELLTASYQAQHQQQHDRADGGGDDRGGNAATDANAEQTGHPAADEGTDDTDQYIDQQTEAASFDQDTCQPASDGTDDDPGNDSMRHDCCSFQRYCFLTFWGITHRAGTRPIGAADSQTVSAQSY